MHLRTLAPLLLSAVALLTGCNSTLNSTTTIPPSNAFELGGGRVGAYTVKGKNSGSTIVEVLAITSSTQTTLGTFEPGSTMEHTFADGEMARFRNLSASQNAELTVVVTGNISSLGMKYQTK